MKIVNIVDRKILKANFGKFYSIESIIIDTDLYGRLLVREGLSCDSGFPAFSFYTPVVNYLLGDDTFDVLKDCGLHGIYLGNDSTRFVSTGFTNEIIEAHRDGKLEV